MLLFQIFSRIFVGVFRLINNYSEMINVLFLVSCLLGFSIIGRERIVMNEILQTAERGCVIYF